MHCGKALYIPHEAVQYAFDVRAVRAVFTAEPVRRQRKGVPSFADAAPAHHNVGRVYGSIREYFLCVGVCFIEKRLRSICALSLECYLSGVFADGLSLAAQLGVLCTGLVADGGVDALQQLVVERAGHADARREHGGHAVAAHAVKGLTPPVPLGDAEAFYGMIGRKLKFVFRGYHAWIIAYDNDQFDRIGLRPSVHYPLLNGALDCELREYVIFDGTFNDMRARGENIRNEGFRASEDKRHLVRREFKETFADEEGGEHRPRQMRRDERRQHREDRRDERRPRRDGDRPHDRRDDRPRRDGDRPRRDVRLRRDGDRPRRDDGGRRSPCFTPGQGPTLGADKEVTIIHGRRKSWKRQNLPEDEK